MRAYLQTVCLLLVLATLLWIPAGAVAQTEPYAEIGPEAPRVGDEVFITLHSNDDGLAMVYLVGGPNASVSFQKTINIENGSAKIGPFILSEGNYSLSVIFWSVENGSLETSYYNMEFSVARPDDRYEALFVVIVGI
ncbi:MAG: hypothetical protein QCI38_07615, partial [Candidatus Thermoplasmatota archaeon]|nr:hypothetical protein [Candidatus Thermoplasmatota archaeon]